MSLAGDSDGPRMPPASAAALPQPDPPTHPATGPLTPARRACNVTRRRFGRTGPTGPRRAGRAPQATRTHLRRHGPPGTGRPRSSWDSDARDHGPPAPRHQVATHDIARAMSRHRPSAFGRDPDPRARFAPLKTPAPVIFLAAASQAARSTVASPSLPPVLSTVPAFFSA
jgi:hypothetical protein